MTRCDAPPAMNVSPAADKPIVVLLGNYPPDRQESMLRFRDMMRDGLSAKGYTVVLLAPQAVVGSGAGKWLGYVDKYVFFPRALRRELRLLQAHHPGRKMVVHICDHSNAVYVDVAKPEAPVLATCHDLLAVRGALGEDTDCPASGLGRLLQRAILRGLGHATEVACVSRATRGDLIRLAGDGIAERSEVIPLALNYRYEPLDRGQAEARLAKAGIDVVYGRYVLHVGSGLKRKNRPALLRSVALIREAWPGRIVFAGEPLSAEERALAQELGVADRVREVPRPDNATLHALYSAAHALIFMSTAEGFGWPVLEAQAAGCPVICSDRTSVPEVAGEGARVHAPDDYAAVAEDIVRLQEPAVREHLVALGLKNALGYSAERMIGAYETAYRRLA